MAAKITFYGDFRRIEGLPGLSQRYSLSRDERSEFFFNGHDWVFDVLICTRFVAFQFMMCSRSFDRR